MLEGIPPPGLALSAVEGAVDEETGGHPWPVGDDWIDYDESYDRWHDHGGYETPRVSDDDQEIAHATKHIEQSTTMPNTQFPPCPLVSDVGAETDPAALAGVTEQEPWECGERPVRICLPRRCDRRCSIVANSGWT